LQTHWGHYFRILHSSTDQTISNALADMELTSAQGHIMGYLVHSPQPPCARDIEEAFQLSHPTVSGLLARLERKGFIELRPDPNDRRCKRIFILPKGQQLQATMHSAIQSIETRLVQDFSPEEKELFTQFLLRAIHNVGICPCKRKEETQE
jgi:DNA-binding MarR family transcriptional regulator